MNTNIPIHEVVSQAVEVSDQADHESADNLSNEPDSLTINDLILFIDKDDVPRIPSKLFDEVCQIKAPVCPGPVYLSLLKATVKFCFIIMFLGSVFIVVLSFGEVYRMSGTSQMLATMAGGFAPFIFSYILKPAYPDRSSVSKSQINANGNGDEFDDKSSGIKDSTHCDSEEDALLCANHVQQKTGASVDILILLPAMHIHQDISVGRDNSALINSPERTESFVWPYVGVVSWRKHICLYTCNFISFFATETSWVIAIHFRGSGGHTYLTWSLSQMGPYLLTWINFNLSVDK